MRKFLLLLFTLLHFYIFTPSASASDEFYTNYIVNHRFDDAGKSTIEQRVSLTNKFSSVYATQYQFRIQGDTPTNISGSDSHGPLKITTSRETPDTTLITVEFNDHVVGIDKTLEFTLKYTGKSATRNGQVWEIVLPKLGTPKSIDTYQLNLIIPKSFGKPAFISPSPISTKDSRYTFNKDQLSKIGVVAAFGNFQTFSFNLKYHLQNTTKHPGIATIPLPPDTNYQRIFYDSIIPSPKTVEIDPDGNWLATFSIPPKQVLEVSAIGQAHILAEPTQPLVEVTSQQLQSYLQPTHYWPSHDPEIQKLGRQLKTPQKIYDYIVSHLNYDYSRVKPGAVRKGGKNALLEPNSNICTEFTDLFITLARAAGIPAREHNGYAYTTDANLRPLSLVDNILHAWPQYWDQERQTWVSVDPTWGKTTGGIDYFNKLDFNHFSFVIHGNSDSDPPPAFKNVQVAFAPYKEYIPQNPTVTWKPPFQISPFNPTTSYLHIKNTQGQAIYRLPVSISSTNIQLKSPSALVIPVIPPLGQTSLPITFARQTLFNFKPKSYTAVLGTQTMTYNIPGFSFLLWQTSVGLLISIIIITLAILASKAWSLHLQRRRGVNPLRWQSQQSQK